MPVSSPSYFPPSRGTDQIVGITAGRGQTGARVFLAGQGTGDYTTISDLILIGDAVMDTGTVSAPITDTNLTGTTVIGSQALTNLVSSGTTAPQVGAIVAYGRQSLNALLFGSNIIAIGDKCLAQVASSTGTPINRITAVGNNIGTNITNLVDTVRSSVIIGNSAWSAVSGTPVHSVASSVIIGDGAMSQLGALGGSIAGNVIIGFSAALSYDSTSGVGQNVFIGSGVCSTACTAQTSVVIGQGAILSAGTSNVIIGQGSSVSNQVDTVVIGATASMAGNTINNVMIGARSTMVAPGFGGCIIIGCGAGGASLIGHDTFVIETRETGGTLRCIMFGNTATGNLVIGNSAPGVNRDLPGTNILKIISGTNTGTPVGGGFFYYNGSTNALHFMDAAGVDTNLTSGAAPPGAGSTISPAALAAGTTNNYSPTGWSTARFARLTPDGAGSSISGFVAVTSGFVTVINLAAVGSGDDLTLLNENAGSTAANQILAPTGGDLILPPQTSATLWYDATSTRWRVIQ